MMVHILNPSVHEEKTDRSLWVRSHSGLYSELQYNQGLHRETSPPTHTQIRLFTVFIKFILELLKDFYNHCKIASRVILNLLINFYFICGMCMWLYENVHWGQKRASDSWARVTGNFKLPDEGECWELTFLWSLLPPVFWTSVPGNLLLASANTATFCMLICITSFSEVIH